MAVWAVAWLLWVLLRRDWGGQPFPVPGAHGLPGRGLSEVVLASPAGVLAHKEGGCRAASSFRVMRSFPGAFAQGTGEPEPTT